jgi:hypothetical protein
LKLHFAYSQLKSGPQSGTKRSLVSPSAIT